MEQVFQIPGKINVQWEPSVRSIVDTWTTYLVTLEQFKEAVLVQGVNYAKTRNVQAWIVDSSSATGSFSQEIQNFIGSDIFPTFAKIGVKYFITITSKSAITKMTIAQYTSSLGPSGINLIEATSASEAVEWLKKNTK